MSDPVSVPIDWKQVITPQSTVMWFRPDQVLCYGDVGTVSGAGIGNSWITFIGTETRWYLLTTVEELHDLLYNTQVKEVTDADGQQIPTEADARYRVGFDQTGQGQAFVERR